MLASELGMAKKEDKKDEKKAKEPLTPEQAAAAAKKKKIIIAVAVGLLVVGGGAFAAIKMLGKSGKDKSDTHATEEAEHGDKPADAETDGSVEGHAEGDADKKTDTKKDEHSKADGHGAEGADHAAKEAEKKADAPAGKDTSAKKDDAHGGGDSQGASKEASGSTNQGKSGRYSGIGLMYDMKPFHLNLGNPLENRYVRLEVRFEYPNEEQKSELSARDSQIRDAIVSIVSRKTREHLLSPDGKDQLRLEIKNRVNQYLEKKITNVYITDILIE